MAAAGVALTAMLMLGWAVDPRVSFAVRPAGGLVRDWPKQLPCRRGFSQGLSPGQHSRLARTPQGAATVLWGEIPLTAADRIRSAAELAARGLVWACAASSVLVVLLYATAGLEALMHSASGLLSGSSIYAAAVTGVALGILHTIAGPDHLAGLAPMVVGQGHSASSAFGLGALWGSGHAAGQSLIGLACLAAQCGILRQAWAPALGQCSTALIGASLVGVGLLGLREARSFRSQDVAASLKPSRRRRFGWATFGTGLLHGLSPDALLFIAPALALPRAAAISHVAGVVVGTLVAMGASTTALSALCRGSPRLGLISGCAASVAILLGAVTLAASLGLQLTLPGL